jgi:saccharopine dehydrogenase (NAD+, L-lysine-forming)
MKRMNRKIGIVRETKSPPDNRVPLSPEQCRQVEDAYPGLKVIVQPSDDRCFTDAAYEKEGITVKNDLGECDVLMGVKEVMPRDLIAWKTYFFFSHTIKKQKQNKALLQSVLDKQIRLLDYEILTDIRGGRIIGFGRWAGLVGTYNGIRALCKRYRLPELLPPQECHTLENMMRKASLCKLPPVRIALTGDGRVAGGSEEMLTAFGISKVSVEEYLNDMPADKPVYVQLGPDQYNRHKSGKSFDLLHFFKAPVEYESHFDRFCDKTDMLITAAFWDPRAPLLFTAGRMKDATFRIRVIADITCDMNGSLPSSIRTTSFPDPFYDFNRESRKEETAFSHPENITVMTIDNLPCGLPAEASEDFGRHLMKHVLPLLMHGDRDEMLARATIAENGRLTERYNYLAEWVSEK